MADASIFASPEVSLTRRADGAMILRALEPLPASACSVTDWLKRWAAEAPDCDFLAERDASGAWRRVTYSEALAAARSIAQCLIDKGLSAERPLAIFSGNSINHALLGLGATMAGIPYASISPAYSLISSDFAKLAWIVELLTPGLVYAEAAAPFAKAIATAVPADTALAFTSSAIDGRAAETFQALAATPVTAAVDQAEAAITPDTIVKFLFTSGSTGAPKGVINTQAMLTANQAMIAAHFPGLVSEPPVLVEWLPWSHTFGANHNFNYVLANGGTLYIDAGKPLPGAINETAKNLGEIAPTLYFNVPKGFEMLLPLLRADAALRKNFFSRLKALFYAGASLPAHVRAELEAMALTETGNRIPMLTSLGSTETAPASLAVTAETLEPGVIGIPMPGAELKLVPNAGKLEARLKGPNIMPGYWRQPELAQKTFDGEGYYLLGDALAFADPADPRKGLRFDGRIAEDFKLKTGTWVSAGPLRAAFIAGLAPLARDAVIAGHDRDEVTALVVPDLDACREAGGGTSPAEILAHPELKSEISLRLKAFNATAGGSSGRIARALLMEAPLSIDKGEITDKGSVNQRAVLSSRPELVDELYSEKHSPRVIS